VLIFGRKQGMTPQMAKELKRRSAIEPVIGHIKTTASWVGTPAG
jgi:hypothetical protein